MAEILSLRGDECVSPDEPRPFIITILRKLLAQAEAGEIKVFAGVIIAGNGEPEYFTALPPEMNGAEFYVLHSGAVCLAHEISSSLVVSARRSERGGDDAA